MAGETVGTDHGWSQQAAASASAAAVTSRLAASRLLHSLHVLLAILLTRKQVVVATDIYHHRNSNRVLSTYPRLGGTLLRLFPPSWQHELVIFSTLVRSSFLKLRTSYCSLICMSITWLLQAHKLFTRYDCREVDCIYTVYRPIIIAKLTYASSATVALHRCCRSPETGSSHT